MGKRDIEIKYKYSEHNKVTKWLFEHANITSIDNMDYTDDGMITLQVPIDDVTYQKYLKHFEPEKFDDSRVNQRRFPKGHKLAPPPGWN
jgi:hypothetical protein